MSKVITLSRVFLKRHPREGEPTYFVEKFYAGIGVNIFSPAIERQIAVLNKWMSLVEVSGFVNSLRRHITTPIHKYHTIRAGCRLHKGEMVSLRVWSGKPYQSKQIILAPDIEIKNCFDFCIDPFGGEYRMNGFFIPKEKLEQLSTNDGLLLGDFEAWFKVKTGFGFSGQIICWSDLINY